MVMKVLIELRNEFSFGNRIVQIVPDGEEFPVAPDILEWVDGPDSVTEEWTYNGIDFLPPTVVTPKTKMERLIDKVNKDKLIKGILTREANSRSLTLNDILIELEPYVDDDIL